MGIEILGGKRILDKHNVPNNIYTNNKVNIAFIKN